MWRERSSGPPCNPCCFYLLAWHVEDRLKGVTGCSTPLPAPPRPAGAAAPPPPRAAVWAACPAPRPCRPGASGQVSHKELSVWAARWPARRPPRRDALPSRVHPPPPRRGLQTLRQTTSTHPWAGASWGGVRPWPETPTPARVDLCHLATLRVALETGNPARPRQSMSGDGGGTPYHSPAPCVAHLGAPNSHGVLVLGLYNSTL